MCFAGLDGRRCWKRKLHLKLMVYRSPATSRLAKVDGVVNAGVSGSELDNVLTRLANRAVGKARNACEEATTRANRTK